jgi:hypothetical protein
MTTSRRLTSHTATPVLFTSSILPFAVAATRRFGPVPALAELEPRGWVRVGAVPRLTGLRVMRRGVASGS